MLHTVALMFAAFVGQPSFVGQPGAEGTFPVVDKLAETLPAAVRESYLARYGDGYWIWRVEVTLDKATRRPLYDLTVFRPGAFATRGRNDSLVHQLQHYKLVIRQSGEVIEEERHAVGESFLPKAVAAAYEAKRREFPRDHARPQWFSQQAAGGKRRFSVTVIFDARRRYSAQFDTEGNVIEEKRTNF